MDYHENRNNIREWVDCNIYGLNYCLEKVKLISLISEVLERLPSKDREIIMYKRGVRFIAPITANCLTEQIFIDPISVRNKRYEPMVGIWLVCLSSDILNRPKNESLYTIALELAHVYLEHQKKASMIEGFSEKEREVDGQVIKWNFKSEFRQTPFNHNYGNGRIQNESSVTATLL
jgi:hypothetical protein